jgi:hypothetical protein
MNAVLNIYKDCTSEEPSKKYICRRLLLGVSKKVQALSDNMNGKSEEEQAAITLDILKTIFPHFDDSDFDFIDPTEWLKFVNEIAKETNEIVTHAAKK